MAGRRGANLAVMESEQPTQQMPPPPPRRLTRSRTDRVLGGVCGGIGRALGIDALIVRILAVALLFAGGISLIVYVAMLVLVPEEAEGAEQPPPERDTNTAVVVLVAVGLIVLAPILLGGGLLVAGLLFPLAFIALAGMVTWWLVSGEPFAGDARDVIRRASLGLLVLWARCCCSAPASWAPASAATPPRRAPWWQPGWCSWSARSWAACAG